MKIWKCEYCDSESFDDVLDCRKCGAPKPGQREESGQKGIPILYGGTPGTLTYYDTVSSDTYHDSPNVTKSWTLA